MKAIKVESWVTGLPVAIFAILVLGIAFTHPPNDLTRFFIPAGDLLIGGDSPYVLNLEANQPFIYAPFGLWIFPIIALIPQVYYVMLALNAGLLFVSVRRLAISRWWCLYPAALYVILAGQLDLLVFWLGLEAFQQRKRSWSCVLLSLALAIKPQIALFWILPIFYGLENVRQRIKYGGICLALLGVPMLIYLLAQPDFGTLLWRDWIAAVQAGAGAYVGDSPSFWAIGWVPAALVALILWIVFGRDQRLARPLLALGLPALRYYSSVGLLGAAPTWGIVLGYLVAVLTLVFALPLLWIEPLVVVMYYVWRRYSRRNRGDPLETVSV